MGAYLLVDIAHIAGLVATGLHPSPVPYADFVTTTTHKTLRGPRGGMIMTNNEDLAKAVDKAIFPGSQGGPLMHIIAAKAVAFKEALSPEFKGYQAQVIKNAKALADGLKARGIKLVTDGTDNHLMLLNLVGTGVTGKSLEKMLDEVHITANKNTIPNEPLSPFVTSGLRIGTPAVTSRGFGKEEMIKIAKYIKDVIYDFENSKERITKEIDDLENMLNVENLKLQQATSISNHEKLHYIKEFRRRRWEDELDDKEVNELYKTIISSIIWTKTDDKLDIKVNFL